MPINLWPADDVHLATVDEDIIVLDTAGDQYGCLFQAAAWIRLTEDGAIIVPDEPSASELLAAGLATFQRPAHDRRCPTAARRERNPQTGGHPIKYLGASLDLFVATLAFRGRHFHDLIRPTRIAASRQKTTRDHALASALVAYGSVLPWVPFEGECLQRAFQLRRLLASRGITADWVFGVRTWPFGAHCWLQIEDEVVGDSLARVCAYTPIMVV